MTSVLNIAVLSLFGIGAFGIVTSTGTNKDDSEKNGFALDEQAFTKVKEIHRNWYFFSIKALLGQLGKGMLRKLDSASRQRLKICLKRIVYTKDLRRTAICLLKAREQRKKQARRRSKMSNASDNKKLCKPLRSDAFAFGNFAWKLLSKERRSLGSFTKYKEQRLNFRNTSRLWLRNNLAEAWRAMITERRTKSFVQVVYHNRVKRSPNRLILPPNLRSDSDLAVKTTDSVPPLKEQAPKNPVHRIADLFVSLFGKTSADELPKKWSSTYKSIKKLSKVLDNNEHLPGARVYSARIYDLVTDSGENTLDGAYIPPFLKNAFGIVNSFTGAKNARILSPRLVPITPDKAATNGFLSPSLFPLYRDDAEQQIMPIPKILEEVGLNEKERERVLEMVMEVSGARDAVDKAVKILKLLTSMGMGDKLFSFNEKIEAVFEQLRSSLSRKQNKDLNKKGFTFMNPTQMEKFHRDQGVKEPAILEQVNNYKTLSAKKQQDLLWESVAKLAGTKRRRTKRQFQPVVVGQPFILAPYQFAPIFGLSILGPVVLSPNIFSPLILNPAVFGPWVLSPGFPLPFILSPYVFSPYILNPVGMAPFVFSPYSLSPNIVTPYILSPVVLSPLALSPDILSPMVLGGQILSPTVLSPSLLSKSYLMANVLSPSLLS